MRCTECQEQLAAYGEGVLASSDQQAVALHLDKCPVCGSEADQINRLRDRLVADGESFVQRSLEIRVMDRIFREETIKLRRIAMWKRYGKAGLGLVAAAAAAALVVVNWSAPKVAGRSTISAFRLLSEACAAEESLFVGDGVVHIVNEIVVQAAVNPVLARGRWIPLMSLEATGRPRFHQLTLPAEPGESYTVDDQAWYEPATGRFARLLAADGKPIFANAYDGQAVYSLEVGSDGAVRVVEKAITQDFRPPDSPAEFLGIAAGLHSTLDGQDENLVLDAGDGALEDGSPVRIFQGRFPPDGPEGSPDAHWLFKIRKDDKTIAEMEWIVEGESLLVVRRAQTDTVESPGVRWDLAGLESPGDEPQQQPQAGLVPDMVIPNVSVQHMVDKAGFETCIFATDPPWASERQIADILDVVSPPHRMFCITYRADDGRHVVLVQSHSYNKMLGSKIKLPQAEAVYQSPKGFKVWTGPSDRLTWLAGVLLQSARHAIKDPPAEDRTGYLLETPAGTYPALAINGQVTDEELHALIDSLVPASEHLAR